MTGTTVQQKRNYEPRPKSVDSRSHRVRMACGNLYITISNKDGKLFEVFATLGKSGGCMFSSLSALTMSITMGVRHGVDPQIYVDKLKGINCPSKTWEDNILYLSCADAIGQVMETEMEYIKSISTETKDTKTQKGKKTNACNSRDKKIKDNNPNQLQGRKKL